MKLHLNEITLLFILLFFYNLINRFLDIHSQFSITFLTFFFYVGIDQPLLSLDFFFLSLIFLEKNTYKLIKLFYS